jgi:hypothetical protein
MAATAGKVVDVSNTIPNTVANLLTADGQGVDWLTEVLLLELTVGSVYNDTTTDSNVELSFFWGLFPQLQWDSAVGIPTGSFPAPATTIYRSGPAGDIGTFTGGPAADLDSDEAVTILDLNLLLNNMFQTVPPADPRADITNDGIVDGLDFIEFNNAITSRPDVGLLASDAQPALVSATWFNLDVNQIGPVQTGTITLSNDAIGTWSRITSFEDDVVLDGTGIMIEQSGVIVNGVFMVPEPTAMGLVYGCIAALTLRRRRRRF